MSGFGRKTCASESSYGSVDCTLSSAALAKRRGESRLCADHSFSCRSHGSTAGLIASCRRRHIQAHRHHRGRRGNSDPLAVVIDPALPQDLATGIQNTGPMELRPPVELDVDAKLTLHRTSLLHDILLLSGLGHRSQRHPCTGAQKGADSPQDFRLRAARARRSSVLGGRNPPPGLIRGVLVGRPSCLLL